MRLRFVALLLAATPLALQAQSGSADTDAASSWSGGATFGTVKFARGATETGIGGIAEYQPAGWATFSINPSTLHLSASRSGRTYTTTGLGDTPVSALFSRDLSLPWEPTLLGGVDVVLPTGKSACGLGSGETSWSGNLGIEASPADPLTLGVSASRDIGSSAGTSALTAATATTLAFDAGYVASPVVSLALSYSADVGSADSTQQLTRYLGGGVTVTPGQGRFQVVLDVNHGLTTGTPNWAVSLGVGSAFGGIGDVSASRRLRRAFLGSGPRRSAARLGLAGC
jgi:hypothetical protein